MKLESERCYHFVRLKLLPFPHHMPLLHPATSYPSLPYILPPHRQKTVFVEMPVFYGQNNQYMNMIKCLHPQNPWGHRRWGKGGGGDIVVVVNTSSPFSVHFTFSSKVISPYWFVRRRGTEIELPSTVISCGNSIVKEFDHTQCYCVGHISVVVKEAIL